MRASILHIQFSIIFHRICLHLQRSPNLPLTWLRLAKSAFCIRPFHHPIGGAIARAEPHPSSRHSPIRAPWWNSCRGSDPPDGKSPRITRMCEMAKNGENSASFHRHLSHLVRNQPLASQEQSPQHLLIPMVRNTCRISW